MRGSRRSGIILDGAIAFEPELQCSDVHTVCVRVRCAVSVPNESHSPRAIGQLALPETTQFLPPRGSAAVPPR